jgi:hypothetical protein
MKHLILALALLILTLPAFAETPQTANPGASTELSDTVDTPLVYEDLDGEYADLDLLAPEEPEQPTTVPDRSFPRPWHSWTCVAANRWGQRFVARSFIPGQARSMALRECRLASRPHWWARSCHIVRCFRR